MLTKNQSVLMKLRPSRLVVGKVWDKNGFSLGLSVWLFGCLVGWLVGCLFVCLFVCLCWLLLTFLQQFIKNGLHQCFRGDFTECCSHVIFF